MRKSSLFFSFWHCVKHGMDRMDWNGMEWNEICSYFLITWLIYVRETDTENRSRPSKVCSLSHVILLSWIYLKLSCQNKLEEVNTCIKLLCVSHKNMTNTAYYSRVNLQLVRLNYSHTIPPVCSWDIIWIHGKTVGFMGKNGQTDNLTNRSIHKLIIQSIYKSINQSINQSNQ